MPYHGITIFKLIIINNIDHHIAQSYTEGSLYALKVEPRSHTDNLDARHCWRAWSPQIPSTVRLHLTLPAWGWALSALRLTERWHMWGGDVEGGMAVQVQVTAHS